MQRPATYDRAVVKSTSTARGDAGRFPKLEAVVLTSEASGIAWRYRFDIRPRPTAPGFDDVWSEARAGSARRTPGAVVRTPWTTPEIWLRRTFELDVGPSAEALSKLFLSVHHDDEGRST